MPFNKTTEKTTHTHIHMLSHLYRHKNISHRPHWNHFPFSSSSKFCHFRFDLFVEKKNDLLFVTSAFIAVIITLRAFFSLTLYWNFEQFTLFFYQIIHKTKYIYDLIDLWNRMQGESFFFLTFFLLCSHFVNYFESLSRRMSAR